MPEKISVIIPVFQVEIYLNRCIESVVNQTYSNLEIILIDDGSRDMCPQICDDWARKDNRIYVIHKENGGLSDARNEGINIATGEFILFVDSDDIIAPYMIEYLYNQTIINDADIAITKMISFNDEELPLFTNKGNVICGLANNMICKIMYESSRWEACGKLYKKALFNKEMRFIKDKIYEDLYFTLRIFSDAKMVVFCDNAMYGYFKRNDSIMGKSKYIISSDLIEILQLNIDFIYNRYGVINMTYNQLFASFIIHPSSTLEQIEINKSYKNNYSYIKEYKKFIKRNWQKISVNKYISKKYKLGLFISMYSVSIYNKLFNIIRYLHNLKVIQWER